MVKANRVPVRGQDPAERVTNFNEVSYGYNSSEAVLEASRCIQCKNPRCVAGCPVSIQIPTFIKAVLDGNMAQAATIIAADSSLPAICGRVCPQEVQCEGACILGIKHQPISIGKLERYVADWAKENQFSTAVKPKPNGKKVAIIGSGPAGLACATDLARAGCEVTIFEALHKPGGVLVYGIPEFRLPKEAVVEYEIGQLQKMGVKIECNVVVGRTVTIDQLFEKEGFHAVFIGTGAGLPKFLNIPGENFNGVVSANEFLTRSNLMAAYSPDSDTPIYVGRRVTVVGGGNVAMDAARTALRLGAEVTVVYRRTEKEMPARIEEVHHAKEEGVVFQLLSNPVAVLGNEKGWVTGLKCVRMELGEPDESGRRRPVEVAGSAFDIPCDVAIIALGTNSNPLLGRTTPGLEMNRHNGVVADENGLTSRPGVFAGGDVVTGAATVILAMGAGRKAAKSILEFLKI